MNKTIIHTEPTQYHYDNTKWLYKFMYAFFFGFVQNNDNYYSVKPNKKVNISPFTLYSYDTFSVLNTDYDYFCGDMTMRTQYTYGSDSAIAQAIMPSSETGFDYFGARFPIAIGSSDLSVWLSVDPMSDERPNLSPYNYSSWNPIMRIDPDGELDDWVERDGEIVNDKDVTKGEDGKIQNLKEGDKYLGKEGWDLQYHYRPDGTKAEYSHALKETTIVGLRGSGPVVSAMEDAINKGYDPTWYPGFRRVVDAALTYIEIELAAVMFATAMDDIAMSAGDRSAPVKPRVRSLDDLSSLRGASWKEAESLIPKNWIPRSLNKGEGIKYVNPAKKGEQILLEKGWPGAKDPLHAGPYMKASRDGTVTRIPLQGNPTLN